MMRQINLNRMKRTMLAAAAAVLCALLVWQEKAGALEQRTEQFQLDSGTRRVVLVQFHPSEHLMIRPAYAPGGIGSTATLQEMAEHHQAVAAINGTFFNAYDANDLHPMGAIMIDREFVHIRGGSIMMGMTASGELEFSFHSYIPIRLYVNGVDRLGASFVNHMLTSPEEIVIFTPTYRSRQLASPGAHFVIVEDGVVSGKKRDSAEIPENGFVVAFGANRERAANLLEVGDQLTYAMDLGELESALHLISVGPKLVTDGKVDVDFERDRFTDPKMTSIAAQRSFIGAKEDGTIVMGTAANVTIPELAELARRLGLKEAMNLDGGASSGLYYEGKVLTPPGRKLSNSLVVVRQPRSPRIVVNGKELFLPGKPYVHDGITMVPVELLGELGFALERSGGVRGGNGGEAVVTGRRIKESVRFEAGSDKAVVNGAEVHMPAAAVLKDGHLYVPVRALTEAAGAKLSWDGNKYMVTIESSLLSASRLYEQAEDMYRRMWDADGSGDAAGYGDANGYGDEHGGGASPDQAEIRRRQDEVAGQHLLALYVDMDFPEAEASLAWLKARGYEMPGNSRVDCPPSEACLTLGWSFYRANDNVSAWEAFQAALQAPSLAAEARLGLGMVYLRAPFADAAKAEEHLRQALQLAEPDSDVHRRAKELLEGGAANQSLSGIR